MSSVLIIFENRYLENESSPLSSVNLCLPSFCFTDAVTFVTRESVWAALHWKWQNQDCYLSRGCAFPMFGCIEFCALRSINCERIVRRPAVPLADSIAVNTAAYSGILHAAQVHHKPQTATKASIMAHLRLKQDRQCIHNVALRRVNVTIVAFKKQLVLRILSVAL